jgi:hypothetical protein
MRSLQKIVKPLFMAATILLSAVLFSSCMKGCRQDSVEEDGWSDQADIDLLGADTPSGNLETGSPLGKIAFNNIRLLATDDSVSNNSSDLNDLNICDLPLGYMIGKTCEIERYEYEESFGSFNKRAKPLDVKYIFTASFDGKEYKLQYFRQYSEGQRSDVFHIAFRENWADSISFVSFSYGREQTRIIRRIRENTVYEYTKDEARSYDISVDDKGRIVDLAWMSDEIIYDADDNLLDFYIITSNSGGSFVWKNNEMIRHDNVWYDILSRNDDGYWIERNAYTVDLDYEGGRKMLFSQKRIFN